MDEREGKNENETEGRLDFIREIVRDDVAAGKNDGRVHTRFPPEPNGYLHIGHAKSICLNFGLANEFGGLCNLRMDDTNPETEEMEYVEAIVRDVRWLGFDWADRMFYASDYFDQLYKYAVQLVRMEKAYVDSLSEEEIRAYRGTVTEPGRVSPYAGRPVEENLDLLNRMKAGEFSEGSHVLRARIDMASPNMKMRDPLIYRIKKAGHYRTGEKWAIYPMYDFAHCLSDAIEGITHSICTLEFENNRELYDWFIDQLPAPSRPRQIEFARLNLTYTVLSKRKLIQLVEGGHVSGWDDPRMPTIAGIRRRGYTPESIRAFCDRIGVAKRDSVVDVILLENSIRDDLGRRAPRAMAVLRPILVVIDDYPEEKVEDLTAENHPDDPTRASRKIPFSREIYIERDDFMENPPKKFFRLSPGTEVRLKHAYIIRCVSVEKAEDGSIIKIHCTHDPASRGGMAPDGRKVKGTLHWVSAAHAVRAEVRLYDHLFREPEPFSEGGKTLGESLNPDSLEVLTSAVVEPSLGDARPGQAYQFLRNGYFTVDAAGSKPGRPVFNRTVSLRDTWAKISKSVDGG